jgi:hypothetical protein
MIIENLTDKELEQLIYETYETNDIKFRNKLIKERRKRWLDD